MEYLAILPILAIFHSTFSIPLKLALGAEIGEIAQITVERYKTLLKLTEEDGLFNLKTLLIQRGGDEDGWFIYSLSVLYPTVLGKWRGKEVQMSHRAYEDLSESLRKAAYIMGHEVLTRNEKMISVLPRIVEIAVILDRVYIK